MIHKTCPDCNAALGKKHEDGCDVERCPHCGGQALGCVGFNPNDPRREPWPRKWPGRPIVNVSVSSSPATARCLISTVSLRSVFGTRNGNGGNNPPVGECETCIDRLTKQPKKGWSGTPDVLIGKTDHLPWYERLLIVVVWDLLNMPRSERVLAALAWAVLCLAVLFIVYHH